MKMMKKMGKKVSTHLKKDIKEEKMAIKDDKKLMKTVKGKSCG
jgi:hypothetical protein